MNTALLLVDLQNDFLDRSDLVPPRTILVPRVAELLAGFRAAGRPVIHAHTLYRRDGSDRMPHQKHNDQWLCIEDTPGCRTPVQLSPGGNERQFTKTVYSTFSNAAFVEHLHREGVQSLVIAGVHTHACVRQTALDAYQRGFGVRVAADAVATYDPLHGHLSRRYLDSRGIAFVPVRQLLAELGVPGPAAHDTDPLGGIIGGAPVDAGPLPVMPVHDPSQVRDILFHVALCGSAQVRRATAAARQHARDWSRLPPDHRRAVVQSVAMALKRDAENWVQQLVTDVAKPRRDAAAEVMFCSQLIDATVAHYRPAEEGGATTAVRACPLGVVAMITPWNNPISIPLGKIIPALLYGNSVVWKPPPAATRIAIALAGLLAECGVPPGAVNVISGDGDSGRALVCDSEIDGVTFTGATATGREIALLCAERLLPLQAELGGNNPLVVMDDVEPGTIATDLVRSMFGFAGQRCTATRRILAQSAVAPELRARLLAAIAGLKLGPPDDAATDIGPLLSKQRQQAIARHITAMSTAGAKVLCGGAVPAGLEHGCWYMPTLLEANSGIPTAEAFGPVATFETFVTLDDAIARCNATEYGLVASIYTNNTEHWRSFRERVLAGSVKLNQPTAGIDPVYPFAGWKQSGLGPAEHGSADKLFYSRTQTVYGDR